MPVKYDKESVIKPGTNYNWTQEMVLSFAQSMGSVKNFALNNCKVRNLDGIVPLELRDYQMRMLDIISNNRLSVLNCPRQIGKSTIVGLFCLWNAIFAPKEKPVEIWILSNKGASAQSFLGDIKGTYQELDPYIKAGAGVVEWNKTSIEFENGSKIISGTTSKDTIRGETPNFVVMDEFAHVAPHVADEFFTAVWPTIATGGKMIVISTPNGNTNKFYELFNEAGDGPDQNGFAKFDMEWDEVPNRDDEFKQKQIKATSLQKWYQEFEAKFLGSADTLINGEFLPELSKQVEEPMMELDNYQIWEKPRSDQIYVICCDVAKGVGKDFSVINILNATNPDRIYQVAVWASNTIDPFDFADKIDQIGKYYFEAFVVIEGNTYGHEVGRKLFETLEYPNIYKERKKRDFGITSTTQKKRLGTTLLKRYIENRMLLIKDRETYNEFCAFTQVNPDVYKAAGNGHDDRVMSLLWGVYFIESDYWKEWSTFLRQEKNKKVSKIDRLIEEEERQSVVDITQLWGDDQIIDNEWLMG